MDDSTSDCQLNQSKVDFETESSEVPETFCGVDDQFIPKVGMTFNTLKMLQNSTRIIRRLQVVLHHSHPCCPDQAQMLKQHRELSMSVCRTIDNNEEGGIKPSKTFQSFVAAVGGHRELNFIEKDYGLVNNKWLSESEELTAILHHSYDNVMVKMEELKAKRKGTCLLSHEDDNLESVNELQSPPRVRTRGRPKNRLSSKLDKHITNASKKKKMKALSDLNLFDTTSVVQANSSH
ncbi:hypothetical protein Ahy_B05g078763 [Arachis hypogaea]|uniref:Uncharacterized protein n=1 Tax=Arachis hypogaea TaxID=3818 RepID=A0A444Z836_ARAHY|nr:hypothetical protein Ahy_B05g078763 [Arachis hypogaea]